MNDVVRIDRHYLGATYSRTNEKTLAMMISSVHHDLLSVMKSRLNDDTYARVDNESDVRLAPYDYVYIDKFGRVNAFVHDGGSYVLIES